MSIDAFHAINLFREKLANDPENLNARREFHEKYEWIEAIWFNFYNGKNEIDKFSADYGSFFWSLPEFREVVRKLSCYPPGRNSDCNFEPTETIIRATYYLIYHCDLKGDDFQENEIESKAGSKWKKPQVTALLTTIKQICNNLSHGRKSEFGDPEYTRNKELVQMALTVTNVIHKNIEQAQ